MKLINNYTKVIFIFILITLLISPIRGLDYGLKLSSVIGSCIYFLLTLFMIKKYKNSIDPTIIMVLGLLGVSVVRLPFHIIYFNDTFVSMLEFIIHLSAIVMGYLFTYLKTDKIKIIYCIICFIVVVIVSTIVYDAYLQTVNSCSI